MTTDHTPSGLPQPQTVADERAIIEACDAIRSVKYHPATAAYGETVRAILRALSAPAVEPVAVQEAVAKAIYEQWISQPGYKPWVERGNSLMQDKARDIARAALPPLPVAPKAEPSDIADEGCIRKALSNALAQCDVPNALRLAIFDAFMPKWRRLATPQAPKAEQAAPQAEAQGEAPACNEHPEFTVLLQDGTYKCEICGATPLPAQVQPAEQVGPVYPDADLSCGLSTDGVLICGSADSIKRVKDWLHAATAVVPVLRAELIEARALASPAPQPVSAEAIPAEQAAPTEPAMYQFRRKNRFNGQLGEWQEIDKKAFFEIQKDIEAGLVDSNFELRRLYAHPQGAADRSADPLQGAANWLRVALDNCRVVDLQHNLRIGRNRAERLYGAAMGTPAAAEPGKERP